MAELIPAAEDMDLDLIAELETIGTIKGTKDHGIRADKIVRAVFTVAPSAIGRALAAEMRVDRLLAGIRHVRDQRGDDRCWKDLERLYALLPEGYTPPVRDSTVELENCRQYIASCNDPSVEYVSPQRRIEELEAENARLRGVISEAAATLEGHTIHLARHVLLSGMTGFSVEETERMVEGHAGVRRLRELIAALKEAADGPARPSPVHLLWFTPFHHIKHLLGVYATREAMEAARERRRLRPGWRAEDGTYYCDEVTPLVAEDEPREPVAPPTLYLLWYDNGEKGPDRREHLLGVFASREERSEAEQAVLARPDWPVDRENPYRGPFDPHGSLRASEVTPGKVTLPRGGEG